MLLVCSCLAMNRMYDRLGRMNSVVAEPIGRTMKKIYGLLAICFLIAPPASAETRILQEELPDAIIDFAFNLRNGLDALKEKREKNGSIIMGVLTGQEDNIYSDFGFAGNFCKVQSGDPGYFCGHTEKNLPRPRAGFVFVTTPIKETGGTVFLIVSSVSPERTRVLSFEEGLPAQLIYDSFSKDNFCTVANMHSPVRAIYHIAVVEPGVLVLRESGNVPDKEGENRIVLSLRDQKCSMAIEEIRAPYLATSSGGNIYDEKPLED